MLTTYEFISAAQGPVLAEYRRSREQVTFIMGPIGSGKTIESCQLVFDHMCEQAPNQNGTRKSRWLAVRNTYPDLKGTTIKDWRELYDNDEVRLGKFNMDFPPTHHLDFDLEDGTRVIAELVFLALDRPDSVRKLRGTQVTGFWLNEVKELPKAIVDMCDGRHGRYPDNCSWHGMIGDTNAPDTDHWYYKLAEEVKPDGWKFLKQPGGVIERVSGDVHNRKIAWEVNPNAENLCNLPDRYYIRQVQSKHDDWIRVNLGNKYGNVSTGKPIYMGTWDDFRHLSQYPLAPMPRVPKIMVGMDFGRTPAAVFAQLMPNGKLRIFKEIIATGMGIRSFMDQLVMPFIKKDLRRFRLADIEVYGDPAGKAKSGNDENSPLGILNDEYKLAAYPTATNDPVRRWESVITFLIGDIDGRPAFELSADCQVLRKGFNGGYQFRRMNTSGEKYADKADKNDYSHCFVYDTPVSIPGGFKSIGDIKPGDLVSTPYGARPVSVVMSSVVTELVELCLTDGRKIICTPNHPFFTDNGIVRADALQYLCVISEQEKVSKLWVDQVNTQYRNLVGSGSTENQRDTLRPTTPHMAKQSICTGMFGKVLTALSQTVCTSITSMATRLIIGLKTLKSYPLQIMQRFTAESRLAQSNQSCTWKRLGRLLLSGTGLQRVELGTANTPSELPKSCNLKSTTAVGAKRNTWQSPEQSRKGFAECHVKVWPEKPAVLMTPKGSAVFADQFLLSTNTPKRKPAARVATVKHLLLQDTVRVYDLTVEGAECFYANGVLVHNCHDALQYLCQGAQGEIDYAWRDNHIHESMYNQSTAADSLTGY